MTNGGAHAVGPRRAVVTGAARGIGRTIASRLIADGLAVVIADVDPAVGDTATEIGATPVVVDLAGDDASDVLAESLGPEPVWLLVNNAGVFDTTPLLDVALASWDRIQAVNTRSMVATMQAVVPAMMRAGGGRVVNMASMAAKAGTAGESAYAASKAAVVALSRIAAIEFGPGGVTVNSICPGYVLTEMGAATRDADQVAAWTSMSPLGRLGEPDDVASMVSYLASDGASYITGQALNVTGGMCTI